MTSPKTYDQGPTQLSRSARTQKGTVVERGMDRDVENLDYTTMYVVCRSVNSNEPEVLNNIEQYQSNVSISLFFSSMFLVDVRRIY